MGRKSRGRGRHGPIWEVQCKQSVFFNHPSSCLELDTLWCSPSAPPPPSHPMLPSWAFWGNMLIPALVYGGTIEIRRGRGTMGMRRKNVKWPAVGWCSVNCLTSFYYNWCISRIKVRQGSGLKTTWRGGYWGGFNEILYFSQSQNHPISMSGDNCLQVESLWTFAVVIVYASHRKHHDHTEPDWLQLMFKLRKGHNVNIQGHSLVNVEMKLTLQKNSSEITLHILEVMLGASELSLMHQGE